MSYRALFTGDLHASNNLPYALKDPNTLVTDRLLDVLDVLEQMKEYALENSITDIWILGDLLDRRLLDAVVLKLVPEQLLEMSSHGLKIRLVPGNHEVHDSSARHYTLELFRSMGIDVYSQTSIVEVDGARFRVMPYLPDAVASRTAIVKQPEPTIMLAHQTIKGGRIGDWVCPDGLDLKELEDAYMGTISGHFHTKQHLGKHTEYLGAPLQHNFGDAGEDRGFWDVEVGSSGYPSSFLKCHFVESRAPDFAEFSISEGDVSSGKKVFDPRTDVLPLNSYIRLKLRGAPAWLREFARLYETELDAAKTVHGYRYTKVEQAIDGERPKERIHVAFPAVPGKSISWAAILDEYIDVCDTEGLSTLMLTEMAAELVSEADA